MSTSWCTDSIPAEPLVTASPGPLSASAVALRNRGHLDGVVELVAGVDHFCARRDDGTVWCRGSAVSGQLGDGTGCPRSGVVEVVDLRDVVQLVSGDTFICALTATGDVWCWGDSEAGQTGIGTTHSGHALRPIRVPGVANVIWIAATGDSAFAVTAEGRLLSWGNTGRALAGEPCCLTRPIGGHTEHELVELHVVDVPQTVETYAIEQYSDILTLVDENFFRRRDGSLWLGGAEVAGWRDVRTRALVGDGRKHACVLLEDGTLRCLRGAFSAEAFERMREPVRTVAFDPAHPDEALVLTATGELYQVGPYGDPERLDALEGVTAIVRSLRETCVAAGPRATLSCWLERESPAQASAVAMLGR